MQVKDNRIKELEQQLEELQQDLMDEKEENEAEVKQMGSHHEEEVRVRDKRIGEQKDEIHRLLENVRNVKGENSVLTLEISEMKQQLR